MLVVVTQLALQYLTVYAVMGGAIVGRVWKKLTTGAQRLQLAVAWRSRSCLSGWDRRRKHTIANFR